MQYLGTCCRKECGLFTADAGFLLGYMLRKPLSIDFIKNIECAVFYEDSR